MRNGYERKVPLRKLFLKARKKSFPQDFSHDMRMMGFCSKTYKCVLFLYDVKKTVEKKSGLKSKF